jgi:hypothetical protein
MPSPPEKEARDSVGSAPSKRLRVRALYSFSLPSSNVALSSLTCAPSSPTISLVCLDSLCGGVPRAR